MGPDRACYQTEESRLNKKPRREYGGIDPGSTPSVPRRIAEPELQDLALWESLNPVQKHCNRFRK